MKLLLLAIAGAAVLLGAGPAPLLAQDAGGGQLTLQQRIDAAAPEDIIVVDGGVFHEPITINKAISLIGRNWPVIDGNGQGDVVTMTADDAVISGFVIRNSSKSISQEPADIKVRDADRVKIRGNRLEDAHFGIHMTDSTESVIEKNDIDAGAHTDIERRGHAIYLWQVTRSTLLNNTIRHAGDGIHLEYSDSNTIGGNDVSNSRYALHFMTAHANRVVKNNFHDNLTGAVLMFSRDLIIKDNELSNNRRGATGAGMLIKDDDNIFVEGNRVLRNKFGATVEGSPQTIGATAIFTKNMFALNDVGIAVMSNAPITFVENALVDNIVQVKAMGGELATRALSEHASGVPATGGDAGTPAALPKGALWVSRVRGNYWSDYRGYDANGDGVGDQPYRPRPPFAGRLGHDDTLRLFQFTPAQQAIDAATDMFPIYRYNAVMEDQGPLMSPPEGLTLPHGGGVNVRLLVASVALTALSGAAIVTLSGMRLRGLRRVFAPRGQAPGAAAA